MNEPKFTEKLIDQPSADLVDDIYNAGIFCGPWHIAKDWNGHKYAVTPFSISNNFYGTYAISCEDFDPCRIAWERGEMDRDEFWERFGYVWRLEPMGRGRMSVERYANHRIQNLIRFMGFDVCNSPIEWMENRFQRIFDDPEMNEFYFPKWQRRYQQFRAAVVAREKQLVDAGLAKPAA